MTTTIKLDIPALLQAYRNGDLTPAAVVSHVLERAAGYSDRNIWIHLASLEELEPYLERLSQSEPGDLPLYGIPFAVKDNIDVAGMPTTAACEAFRYQPECHAFVVEALVNAGAIPIGKTNLDQFATGLVGTRSPEPWGACRNSFDPDYISGGSSSGSAVATALGLVALPWAPTPPVPAGCRRPSTTWSVSSQPWVGSVFVASYPPARALTVYRSLRARQSRHRPCSP